MPITLSSSEPVPIITSPVAVTPPAGAREKVTFGGIVYPEPRVLNFAPERANVAVAVAVFPLGD